MKAVKVVLSPQYSALSAKIAAAASSSTAGNTVKTTSPSSASKGSAAPSSSSSSRPSSSSESPVLASVEDHSDVKLELIAERQRTALLEDRLRQMEAVMLEQRRALEELRAQGEEKAPLVHQPEGLPAAPPPSLRVDGLGYGGGGEGYGMWD